MQKYPVLLLIIVLTAVTLAGDAFLKKAGDHRNFFANRDFLIGLLVYILVAFVWVYVYRNAKFSLSGSIYSILSMLIYVFLGVFMFREKLSPWEYLGIGMGAASFLLLARFL